MKVVIKVVITAVYLLMLLSPLAVAGRIHIQDVVVLDDEFIEWATACEGTELSGGSCLEGVYVVIRK